MRKDEFKKRYLEILILSKLQVRFLLRHLMNFKECIINEAGRIQK